MNALDMNALGMNTLEKVMIQVMVWNLRKRNGKDWPGNPLGAPAVTRYPNILAEIDASGMHLWCPSEYARVSPEVMAAVLEDNEELAPTEVIGLCNLYGTKFSYLIAPTLQMVDPATNKGKAKRRALADWLERAKGLNIPDRWKVEYALETLRDEKPIPYALYHWAVCELRNAIEMEQRRRDRPRSVRITKGKKVG